MNNQILVVVGSDGRIEYTHQDGVFRRSNKQNELVALLLFPNASTVMVNFLRPDGVKPKSQYLSYMGQQEYEGTMYYAYGYTLTDYQLYATGPLVCSLDIVSGTVSATSGDFTIDVEASEGQNDDETPTDTNQFDEAIQSLMQTDRVLIDRTKNVPNLVASIQKVAANAIRSINNSGVPSEPIVLSGGVDAPIPVNTASKIPIPETAWQAEYSGTDIANYTYTIMADEHGQMRDDAEPSDLWVSADTADGEDLLGYFSRYTVDTSGNITIKVNQPIAMNVRVWNGKSIVDTTARDLISAEETRAEAEEQKLQDQINELVSGNVDAVARAAVVAERERAEQAEQALQSNINAEANRAETAEGELQENINSEVNRATAAEESLRTAITDLETTVSGLVSVVSFTAASWSNTASSLYYLGAVNKSVTVPNGKRIVQVLDSNNMPRGTWRNNVIYANEAFAGVAIII